jgi:hypothetical protein
VYVLVSTALATLPRLLPVAFENTRGCRFLVQRIIEQEGTAYSTIQLYTTVVIYGTHTSKYPHDKTILEVLLLHYMYVTYQGAAAGSDVLLKVSTSFSQLKITSHDHVINAISLVDGLPA